MNEVQGAIDNLMANGESVQQRRLALAAASEARRRPTGRDYSKPGHCGQDAEPVILNTGETVAWICLACNVSWHADEQPPGRKRTIQIPKPARKAGTAAVTIATMGVLCFVFLLVSLVLWGWGSASGTFFLGCLALAWLLRLERQTRPDE